MAGKEIKWGVDKAVDLVVEELKKISTPIKDKKDISQVGAISANNDCTIGEIIAEAMEKVGKEGVITVEEAKVIDTTLKFVEGMQFDRGYISPYFVTNPEKMEIQLEEPCILLHEKKDQWHKRPASHFGTDCKSRQIHPDYSRRFGRRRSGYPGGE